ncbi:DNA-binding MarR family transcriptional regulator [Microbacterium sp. ZKA21]|uniref:helix-turn-helix domain-containing protein n=1 Tax=Microbacterium sp. ZKA21 TaxID=3381694 RepID=UPI003D224539
MARITARWLFREGIGELGLTKSEALVLLALLDHAEKGIAWCPQTRLSRELRISRSQINQAQARLREIGALIEHEPGRQGRATRYRFGDVGELRTCPPTGQVEGPNMSDYRGKFNVVDMSSYRTGG